MKEGRMEGRKEGKKERRKEGRTEREWCKKTDKPEQNETKNKSHQTKTKNINTMTSIFLYKQHKQIITTTTSIISPFEFTLNSDWLPYLFTCDVIGIVFSDWLLFPLC